MRPRPSLKSYPRGYIDADRRPSVFWKPWSGSKKRPAETKSIAPQYFGKLSSLQPQAQRFHLSHDALGTQSRSGPFGEAPAASLNNPESPDRRCAERGGPRG